MNWLLTWYDCIILGAVALFLLTVTAWSASAQTSNCAPRDTVSGQLAERYGETRRAIGLTQQGVLEIWSAGPGGTFTVTMTTATGITCMVAAGDAYEAIFEPLPKDDDPT